MFKLIVITPVKNESWILDRFLSVTSAFADLIIIADQQSSDGCLDIYPKYPKVHLIHNQSDKYDEAERQALLLDTARLLLPNCKRVILALDADEILAASSLKSADWQTMINAKPGTVLYFEKPDLFDSPAKVYRSGCYWPVGYIDDGAAHWPKKIHSRRLPIPDHAEHLYLTDIKIMHYAFTRPNAQIAKTIMYSMLENTFNSSHILARRHRYSYTDNFNHLFFQNLEDTPEEWFFDWEQQNIDMRSVKTEVAWWYDEEALKLFSKYGSKRFWFDNIWNRDWAEIANHHNYVVTIKKPPIILTKTMKFVDKLFSLWRQKTTKKISDMKITAPGVT